jgi:hypothetical protein
MAYLYFPDGAPDAEEYESNYLYFNESNTAVVSEIERLLIRKKDDPSVINEIEELCRKSFEKKGKQSTSFSILKTRVGLYFNKMRSRLNIKQLTRYRMKTALA